jgi:large subunit ribosomal protein L4
MSSAVVLNENLEKSSDLTLPESFSDINSHNLYLYNKSHLASLRANTAVSKTRAEVKGGGKKPWMQKGRGGARAGSITSPVFVGGGKAHGATFRNYTQKVNKKQRKLALFYALNEQAKSENLFVVDEVKVSSGKTKDAASYLAKLNRKDTLIIVSEFDEKTYLAFRNLKNAYMISAKDLNAYLISVYSSILIERAVFENIVKEG